LAQADLLLCFTSPQLCGLIHEDEPMPIYCDTCEGVIDRPEELTRIKGRDYCLDCADRRIIDNVRTVATLRHSAEKVNCCGELQSCYMYGTQSEVDAAVYFGDLPTIEDCKGYYEKAKYRYSMWIETEGFESDDLAELELILMPYILEEGDYFVNI